MKVLRRWASPPLILVFLFVLWTSPSAAQASERPIHAAIATAGDNYGHLLSQTGGPISHRRQYAIVAVAAAIGWGVGFGAYYYKYRPLSTADERAHAVAAGTFSAFIAGGLVSMVVAGP